MRGRGLVSEQAHHEERHLPRLHDPCSYRRRYGRLKGEDRFLGNWFGGVYIEEKNFFPNFAVDPKTYLDLYPEFSLTPDEEKAFFVDRRGAVAGRKVVERFGWKKGDIITLRGTIFPGNWISCSRGSTMGNSRALTRPSSFSTGTI